MWVKQAKAKVNVDAQDNRNVLPEYSCVVDTNLPLP